MEAKKCVPEVSRVLCRVGLNCKYTLYMTLYLVISLPKISLPKYRIYTVYMWFRPTQALCAEIKVVQNATTSALDNQEALT
jgi:hypothetical protein